MGYASIRPHEVLSLNSVVAFPKRREPHLSRTEVCSATLLQIGKLCTDTRLGAKDFRLNKPIYGTPSANCHSMT